ncbi:MAG: TetR/AcrR family transcriptional regulator [Nocardioidaceae bacterium]
MGHRDDLLVAARRLLEEKGYARITARDLVAESGTNLASIGYHFGSKEGLLNAAIGTVLDEWTEQLSSLAMAVPDATPLERGLTAWTALLTGLGDKRELLLSFVEALAQAERNPELRQQFAGHYERCRGQVAELVGASLGGLPADDVRCRSAASFVIAVCDGLAVQWLLDPDAAPSADEFASGLTAIVVGSVGENV